MIVAHQLTTNFSGHKFETLASKVQKWFANLKWTKKFLHQKKLQLTMALTINRCGKSSCASVPHLQTNKISLCFAGILQELRIHRIHSGVQHKKLY